MDTPGYATREPIRKEGKKVTDTVPQSKKKIENPQKSQQPTTKKTKPKDRAEPQKNNPKERK